MKAVPLAMAILVLVAGCLGEANDDGTDPGDGTPGGSTDGPGPPDMIDPSALPVWKVGDWWSYQVDYTSGESHTTKIIVYGEDATQYHVTADDRDLILRAAFTHYPTIGSVAKSDLSQTIHGVKVESLRFPMQNGTWTGSYRDFPAEWTTTTATLTTGKGSVEGYVTTMRDTRDGLVRIGNGWSAETKWYTNFTFDFDGVAPPDVTYTLLDWGSNHTGTFPILDIIDGVHRPFPTQSVGPPDPAAPPTPPDPQGALDTIVVQEGSNILWGYFAGAGGSGLFRIQMGHESSGAFHELEWRPSAAGGIFDWEEIEEPDAGQWGISATGTAQNFAFLFVEAYEVRTSAGSL